MSDRPTKWFTADPHLGHARVLFGERANHFKNIDDWNTHILAEMRKCGVRGELYILGDLSMEEPEKWRSKLPKSATLIHGNHDGSNAKCFRAFGKRYFQTKEIKIGDDREKCWLSHYCHFVWPASHHNAYHLYGHTHDQREAYLDELFPERRSMDVCPESVFRLLGEFRPISEFEVVEILGPRKGHDPVSFYKEFRGEYDDG